MVFRTKPDNIKWPAVVWVMGFWFVAAFWYGANRPRYYATISYSISNRYMCGAAFRSF